VSQRLFNPDAILLNIRPCAMLNFKNLLEVNSQMIAKIQKAQTSPAVGLFLEIAGLN